MYLISSPLLPSLLVIPSPHARPFLFFPFSFTPSPPASLSPLLPLRSLPLPFLLANPDPPKPHPPLLHILNSSPHQTISNPKTINHEIATFPFSSFPSSSIYSLLFPSVPLPIIPSFLPFVVLSSRDPAVVCIDRKHFRGNEESKLRLTWWGQQRRNQLVEFCGCSKRTRKRCYCPNDTEAAADPLWEGAKLDTLFMDRVYIRHKAQPTRSGDLLTKYRQVIICYKCKSRHIMTSSMFRISMSVLDISAKRSAYNHPAQEVF